MGREGMGWDGMERGFWRAEGFGFFFGLKKEEKKKDELVLIF